MSAVAWKRWAQWLLPCTWGWTVPACRCARPKSPVALASSRMVPPKPAMPNSSPCGRLNCGMRKTSPYAIPDRSLIRPRLKAPRLRIRAPTGPNSPSAYYAKRRGEASRKHPAAWCWAMALPGFGTPHGSYSHKPRRSSTGSMPKKRCTVPLNPSSAQPAKANHGQRRAELDDGKLHAIVHALRPHADSSAEATQCALYIFRNRARMRYPKFHTQGLCTSTGVLEAGCKVVIGTRLKRAGMHWTVKGADAIIALRCSKLSGRYEDFWERRHGRAAA